MGLGGQIGRIDLTLVNDIESVQCLVVFRVYSVFIVCPRARRAKLYRAILLYVQVRAKTSKGWTEFSDEVYAITGYACM